ncbi:MAG: hypothetical protein QW597_02465 [Thermoplasmataceae archaeon]
MESSGDKQKPAGRSGSLGLGILFLIAFIVAMVILFTDENLQTDFGSTGKYYIHWYGMLIMAIVSLVAAIILFVKSRRGLILAGSIGSIILALFMVADIALYSMVGFSSPGDFATYLFGVTKYPGVLSYIPGLYDLLFIVYIIGAVVGFHSSSRMK